MSFPVLFVAFLDKFHKPRSQTAVIGSLQIGLLYMLTVIPGYLIPRYGFRINVAIGCVFLATGFISSTFVTHLPYLYLTMGFLNSLGASFIMIATDSAPLVIFHKRRTLASIISQVITAVGIAVGPLMTSYLLHSYALHGGFLLLGGITFHFLVLAMLFPPLDRGKLEDKSNQERIDDEKSTRRYLKIVKSPSFWCLAIGELSIDALSNGCRIFVLDRAILNGITESEAVLVMTCWGIFSGISRLFVQLPLINKTPRRKQIALAIATMAWSITTLFSIVFKSYIGFVVYCISAGGFHGIVCLLWYLVLADTTTPQLLVSAYSLQCFIAGPIVMLSVPLAGMIFDYTQSYDIPYIIYSLVGFLGAFSEGLLVYFEKRKSTHFNNKQDQCVNS